MAAFDPTFTITLNAAGTQLVLTDTSNYNTNDEGYTRSTFDVRTFSVFDPYGDYLFSTPTAVNGSDQVVISLDKDRAMTIVLDIQATEGEIPITYQAEATYLALNQVLVCFISKVNDMENCNCDNEKKCTNQRKINNAINSAKYNFTFSDLVNAQKHLDYANELCSKDCDC